MKKIYLLAILLTVQQVLCAQVYKSITVNTAGQLSTLLTPEEKSTTTNLTITGTINVNDIFAMDPYYMPVLSVIDMSQATIVSGTSGFYTYDGNAIPWEGFRNNTVLVSITLPNTVTKIGSQAFQGCTNLESIVIPSSVTEIGGYCFQSCSGLQNVSIPAATTTISFGVFNWANCYITVDPANPNYTSENGILFNKNKTQIILFPASYSGDYIVPSTVTNIFEYAFYKCTKLTSVTIPASVTNSMNNSFYESSGAITVAASNPNFSSLDGILYNKGKSTLIYCPIDISGNITIPSTVTTLDSWAFSGCKELETVTIPTATITIPFGAFSGSSANITVEEANTKFSSTSGVLYNKTKKQLLAIPVTKTGIFAIPESVTYIDDYAFSEDIQISGIYVTNTTPIDLSYNSFSPFKYIDKSSIVLYVPYGSASTYSSYGRWSEFESIIETNGIFLEQTTLAVSNSGEQSQIDFKVIGGWTISSPNDWITYTPSAGVSGDATVTITTSENTSTESRTGTIIIATVQGTQEITITQPGAAIVINSIETVQNFNAIVYPNPAKSEYTVQSPIHGLLQIYSLEGKLVTEMHIQKMIPVVISNVPQGVYAVTVSNAVSKYREIVVVE